MTSNDNINSGSSEMPVFNSNPVADKVYLEGIGLAYVETFPNITSAQVEEIINAINKDVRESKVIQYIPEWVRAKLSKKTMDDYAYFIENPNFKRHHCQTIVDKMNVMINQGHNGNIENATYDINNGFHKVGFSHKGHFAFSRKEYDELCKRFGTS